MIQCKATILDLTPASMAVAQHLLRKFFVPLGLFGIKTDSHKDTEAQRDTESLSSMKEIMPWLFKIRLQTCLGADHFQIIRNASIQINNPKDKSVCVER